MNIFKTEKGTELPISSIKGKPYLEVKFRIVAFVEKYPTWSIETEFRELTEKSAFAKATVRDDQGRIRATAHKHENTQGFADFREKAETGAIGRALAMIGFGTQFAPELEEGERIVDSPVQQRSSNGPAPVSLAPPPPTQRLGEYIIPIGKKYKDKKLSDVTPDLLANFVLWLEEESHKKNEPIKGRTLEFINNVYQYFKEQGYAGLD